MTTIIEKNVHGLPGEVQVQITDPYDSDTGEYTAIKVHPWHRYKGTEDESHAVFISVGNYDREGNESWSTDDPVWSIIVDYDEFLFALKTVFPELRSE